jgi:hypothetical protein
LSDQLSQSKGVICPPAGIDPGISVPPSGGGLFSFAIGGIESFGAGDHSKCEIGRACKHGAGLGAVCNSGQWPAKFARSSSGTPSSVVVAPLERRLRIEHIRDFAS